MMRRPSRLTTALLALGIVTTALCETPLSAAEVYKTIDAEGHVVYTDHADPAAPKTAIQVNTLSAKQAARIAKVQAAGKNEVVQGRKQQALGAAKIAKLDHDAKIECDEAQKKFYAMKESAHLFHQDGDGKRIYYTDAEAAMKREEARQSMVLACTD
jgi:hypothetical protein